MLFLALLLTGAFYATAPFTPGVQGFVRRYFCSHPLEYATTTLFFVGLAILSIKAIGVGAEKSSFRLELANIGADVGFVKPFGEEFDDDDDELPLGLPWLNFTYREL